MSKTTFVMLTDLNWPMKQLHSSFKYTPYNKKSEENSMLNVVDKCDVVIYT